MRLVFPPDASRLESTDAKLIRSCEDLQQGLEVLYRQMPLPELKDTYHDLVSAVENADLLIRLSLLDRVRPKPIHCTCVVLVFWH